MPYAPISNKDTEFDEWSSAKNWVIVGQRGLVTKKKDGIVRIIYLDSGSFAELCYLNNKYHGLRRKIFSDGSYLIEFYNCGEQLG